VYELKGFGQKTDQAIPNQKIESSIIDLRYDACTLTSV